MLKKISILYKSRVVLFGFFLGFSSMLVSAQDMDFDSLLQRIDTIENPVYKPVISLSYGVLNFLGDVKNSYYVPVVGNPAARILISTFIDNQHYLTANFFFMTGRLSGNERSVTDPGRNLNFSSSVYSIGAAARYDFGHLIPEELFIRPYVSLGFEQLNFNTKGDLMDAEGNLYNYWTDGTIRSIPEGVEGAALPLFRDHVYETDLRSYEGGAYNQRSFGIPLELGIKMKISDRLSLSLGSEYHYTFTDFIDNVAYEGTNVPGNKGNDSYFFTSVSMHFDMFSDPETRTIDLLYADLEFDPIFFDDEDGDGILDLADLCPGTPYGIVTDTVGCPLDGDADGVPDYLDKEADTPPGNWVDDNGVSMDEADFLAKLQRDEALGREDLEAYMKLFEDTFQTRSTEEIPEKFISLDTDEDGYISFDELLHVIDDYFDFNVNLTLDDLREVNEFFFSQ